MPSQNNDQDSEMKLRRCLFDKFRDSALLQQQLPTWQPNLTPRTMLPIFFIISIITIPIGVILLYISEGVLEHIIDYTLCSKVGTNQTCADIIRADPTASCECQIEFTLDRDFVGKVFMYYALSNYYQNHRLYIKSRDDVQLLGRLDSEQSTDCKPFVNYTTPIAPCGSIANSLFNDTLKIRIRESSSWVPLLRTSIAFESHRNVKFRNPPGDLKEAVQKFAKPRYWQRNLWELDPMNPDNNGFQNEDLIVWMQTAALPNFRKLYRRVDHDQTNFKVGLSQGNYTLYVTYSYPVVDFEGSKKMILSTTSSLGGKNPFLGILYTVVGCVCLLIGMILLYVHIKFDQSPLSTPESIEMINMNQPTRIATDDTRNV